VKKNALIWAIDPGDTTGWAWALGDGSGEGCRGAGEYAAMTFLNFFYKTLEDGSVPDLVVIEKFTITQRTMQSARHPLAIEVTGALRWMCSRLDVEVAFQQPADVMNLVPNSRLKDLGWYVKGAEHARDALRHLLYRLAKTGQISLSPE